MIEPAKGANKTGPTDSLRSWSVLAFLTVAHALAYVDRQMLNLLVDPIKASLKLSDTQFSLVQGSAFVFAYLLATPLFGRLVDVANRRNILVFSVVAWSLCTALCGLAKSYMGLFLPRFGIGVSEACVLPVAWSLLGDHFSKERMPRALSVFQIGTQLGSGFSLIASGAVIAFAGALRTHVHALEALAPWQMAFMVIGLPGTAFALLLLFSVSEPPRIRDGVDGAINTHPDMKDVGRFFWDRRSFYVRLYLSVGMIAVFQLGVAAWFPSYLIRVHGMSTSATGYTFGMLSVLTGSSGVLSGPLLARWLSGRGMIETPLQLSAAATLVMLLACAGLTLAPTAAGALALVGVAIFAGALPLSLISSAATLATPARMRGMAGSLYTFTTQALGYGAGPTAIALLTDRVFHNPSMVGFSLQIVCCTTTVIAAIMLFTLVPLHKAMLRTAA